MTLIIGIKCKDGIVVGADSAATLGSMGQHTVKQPTKKLKIIDGAVVVGVSGPVGLGQRLTGIVSELWNKKAFAGSGAAGPPPPHIAMTIMRENFLPHIALECKAAECVKPVVGAQAASISALCSALVAIPLASHARLFEFDQQGAPEEKTDDLPFVAIGSGQKSADPFLAFIRRNFWTSGPPSLADGTFATYWALDYSIKGEPAYVSDPKQIVVLKFDGGRWKASELSEDDLAEHRQSVEHAERTLQNYKNMISPQEAATTTAPPPPAPA